MPHTEYTWIAYDRIKLFAQCWKPDGQVKAGLILVHGIGEHSGRYQEVARVINREGYALVGFDFRGHGRSEGTRGHFSYSDAINDIDLAISEVEKIFPGTPVFLYGHSLGGTLVLFYAIKRQSALLPIIHGIIATGPALGSPSPVPDWKIFLAKVMKGIYPSMTLGNGLDVTGLSHNPDIVAAYKHDPLVHPLISVRLGWDLVESGPWLIKHASEFPPIPLLIIQGNADRIVDPEATRKFAKNVIKADITFHLFEGGYHELHNEPNRDEFFNLLLHWLERYV